MSLLRTRSIPLVLVSVLGASLAACGAQAVQLDSATGSDASMSTDGATGVDAIVDPRDARQPDALVLDVAMPDGSTSSLFTHCTSNAPCGVGGTCLMVFPGGLCTRRCTNDRACGTNGVCETNSGVCFPRCTSGGLECDRFGAACYPFDAQGVTLGCYPSCFPPDTTPPAGYAPCDAMTRCDPNQLVCSNDVAMGGSVGDPCISDQECASGRCEPEIDASGVATGFIGGYCIAIGRLPAQSAFVPGQPVPRTNCPPGTAGVPAGGTGEEGDPSVCLRTCMLDGDCRAGYHCDQLGQFSNGLCLPIDCSQAGMTCPSGYACMTDPGSGASVCAPSTMTFDAGVGGG